jgi:hypothetical protein
MSVRITKVSPNQEEYNENDDLRIKVCVKNETGEPATVVLEAVLTSRDTPFPTSIQQLGVRLEPNEQKDVTLYDIKIDERFLVDEYTVYVGLAKQLGEGSADKATFQVVQAMGIL